MIEISGGEGGHLGSAIAHTAERAAAFVRSSDREAYERELEKSRPKQAPVDRGIAERAAKRKADQLARECQDAIDVENKTLIIAPNGYRFRKCIISGKFEHEVLYDQN